MKTFLYTLKMSLFYVILSSLTMPPPVAYQINGGFENYTSLPTCTNQSITRANGWNGLKVSYGSNCLNPSYSYANSGAITDPKYYNNSTGGTSSCPPNSLAAPFGGNGYAYLEFNGFFPNGTAKSNFLLQAPNASIPANSNVSVSVRVNSLGTFTMAQNKIMVYLVPTNVSNILDYIRTKSLANQIPTPTQTQSGSWITSSYTFTTPNVTAPYYIVVGPCNLWCNDANASTIFKAVVDNVTVSY